MPRVIHFEITADNPQRAVDFYTRTFGWTAEKWPGPMEYWLVKTGPAETPGIDGGIVRRTGPAGHINTIDVPSVDEFTEAIIANGGAVAVPKMSIPGVGYVAYFQDTEGSVFSVLQADPNAVLNAANPRSNEKCQNR